MTSSSVMRFRAVSQGWEKGVSGMSEGDAVVASLTAFCGQCDRCASGLDYRCRFGRGVGHARNGGFAEYVTLPARSVMPIPDGVDLTGAAAAGVSDWGVRARLGGRGGIGGRVGAGDGRWGRDLGYMRYRSPEASERRCLRPHRPPRSSMSWRDTRRAASFWAESWTSRSLSWRSPKMRESTWW